MLKMFGLDMVLICFLIPIDLQDPDFMFLGLDLHGKDGYDTLLLLYRLSSSIQNNFLIIFPIFWNYINFCYPDQVNLLFFAQIHSFFLRKQNSTAKKHQKNQKTPQIHLHIHSETNF